MSISAMANTAQALSESMTPKFAVSYLRVSTRGQAERGGGHDEGFSIPAQREANKKKAASLGAMVGKEFVDRGASAKSADRPQLQAMLEYVSETSECRSRYLLRYFGQTEAADCGTCDVCRARRAALPARTLQQMTRRKLIEYIDEKDGEYSLEEIVAEFGNPSGNHSPDYLDILRQLIDNGDVPMYIS